MADTSKIQDIVQQLFRPSGALGPFSTKIDLADRTRLLSDEAYKDLTNVRTSGMTLRTNWTTTPSTYRAYETAAKTSFS